MGNTKNKEKEQKRMSNETVIAKTPYKEILQLMEVCSLPKNGKWIGLEPRHFLYAFLKKKAFDKHITNPYERKEIEQFFRQLGTKGMYPMRLTDEDMPTRQEPKKRVRLWGKIWECNRGIIKYSQQLNEKLTYLRLVKKCGWIRREGKTRHYTYYLTKKYFRDKAVMHFTENLKSWTTDEIYPDGFVQEISSESKIFTSFYLLCGLKESQFTDEEWLLAKDLLYKIDGFLMDLWKLKRMKNKSNSVHLGFYWDAKNQ